MLSEHYEVVAVSSPMKELDEIHKREGVRCIGIPMERHISLINNPKSLVAMTKLFPFKKSVVYWCSKKHKASCEKYKAYILKYKALIPKYMPYILGALHFFEIQQYIRLLNRAFFLTYRQLKKLFCRTSFLWNSTITVDDEISSLHNPISNNKITCDIRKLSFCKCITYSLWK